MSQGQIPPRQPHRPVRRIALPFLVLVSTLAIVSLLWLFFRGSAPRRITLSDSGSTARLSPVVDGWMTGLPDQPVPTSLPTKPLPPVDEDARRDLRNLRKYLDERDAQTTKSLDEIRKLLAQRPPPTPEKAVTRPTTKRPPLGFISHERKDPAPDVGASLSPGTWIPCTLETTLNSEIEGYFTVKTRRAVADSATGQIEVIRPGLSIVAKDTTADLLFGNERIPTFALTMSLPNGQSVDLGQAPIMDATGTNGLTGEVNNHIWRLVWTSIFIGGLQGGQQVLQQSIATDGAGPIAAGIARQGGSVAQQRLGRAQDTRPTITVRPGELCNILVIKPFTLPTMVAERR
jgi:type IV secretory pathway VirB10-like protein